MCGQEIYKIILQKEKKHTQTHTFKDSITHDDDDEVRGGG